MDLSDADREYVVTTVVDLLRHHKRERLLRILERRLELGDYPDAHEADLDRIAHAVARVIDEKLGQEAQ